MAQLHIEIAGPPFDDAGRTAEALARAVHRDDRVQILGGAFIIEALRPYWRPGLTAVEAHEALAAAEPELAAAIETLAPLLLRRELAREEAADALRELAALYAANAHRS